MKVISHVKWYMLTTIVCMLAMSKPTSAAPGMPEESLSVNPQQCVAMKQGTPCFTTVEVRWHLPQSGHYCLHSSQQQQALRCWKNQAQGHTELEIKAIDNVTFSVRRIDDSKVLVSGFIKLAWVYKKKGRPRTSWRLF